MPTLLVEGGAVLVSDNLQALAAELGLELSRRGLKVTAAESCTGGAIAAVITSVSGSSAWFDGAVAAYSNSVKSGLLGVTDECLNKYGAVSEPVVVAMATGVAKLMRADCAIAVSGIAGPAGGVPGKPVGTVSISLYINGCVQAETHCFSGGRDAIREATVVRALRWLSSELKGK